MNINSPHYETIAALFDAHRSAVVAHFAQKERAGVDYTPVQEARTALFTALHLAGIPTTARVTKPQKYARWLAVSLDESLLSHVREQYWKEVERLRHELTRAYVKEMTKRDRARIARENDAALPKNVYAKLVEREHDVAKKYGEVWYTTDGDAWLERMNEAQANREQYLLSHPELARTPKVANDVR
jgi:predicted transposase YbfD/YdcC